jgi:hypothetical protein
MPRKPDATSRKSYVPQPARQEVETLCALLFPNEDITIILALLDEYGRESYERERERVHIAILQLSEGQSDLLLHYIDRAKQDYRDVIHWAEYADLRDRS